MDRWVAEGKVVGGVALIAIDGRSVFQHSFGLRDRERGLPAAPNTIFDLTSLTKPVTCAAAMTLVDEGRLSLDDPIGKFIPEFNDQLLWDGKPPAEPIRISHIMTHSSGLLDSIPESFLITDYSLADLMPVAAARPLAFSAGERWAYANLGFDTLGRIIEIVSGKRFYEWVHSRIFAPLRMKDSFYAMDRNKEKRVAVLYAPKDGRLEREERHPALARSRFISPSNGLYGTAADLLRFYQMLLNQGTLGGRRVLSKSSALAMVTSHTGSWDSGFIPGFGYGLGCSVVTSPQGIFHLHSPGTFGHGGFFQTHAWVDPGRKLVAIILCQHRCPELPISHEIAAFISRSVAIM